jgi:hypothetical protein
MVARIAAETNILSLSRPAVPSKVLGSKSGLLACCRESELSQIV